RQIMRSIATALIHICEVSLRIRDAIDSLAHLLDGFGRDGRKAGSQENQLSACIGGCPAWPAGTVHCCP
ncbi:hypothetical protein AB4144_37650, partial [Rhizobiaceae sp. 2RAB30]